MQKGSNKMPNQRPTLRIHWQTNLTVLSLRGEGSEITPGVEAALGIALPIMANTTHTKDGVRLVWASPDDCFVIAQSARAAELEAALRAALAGQHIAITDVSSGYHLLTLSGKATRSVLAQGCPLDVHPKAMAVGQCAGSHFFKASLWLWPTADSSTGSFVPDAQEFELLVRSSFAPYVNTMINKAALECDVQRAGAEIEAYA
jgi:sarcosine oxidase, subunit gamma